MPTEEERGGGVLRTGKYREERGEKRRMGEGNLGLLISWGSNVVVCVSVVFRSITSPRCLESISVSYSNIIKRIHTTIQFVIYYIKITRIERNMEIVRNTLRGEKFDLTKRFCLFTFRLPRVEHAQHCKMQIFCN